MNQKREEQLIFFLLLLADIFTKIPEKRIETPKHVLSQLIFPEHDENNMPCVFGPN